ATPPTLVPAPPTVRPGAPTAGPPPRGAIIGQTTPGLLGPSGVSREPSDVAHQYTFGGITASGPTLVGLPDCCTCSWGVACVSTGPPVLGSFMTVPARWFVQ